MRCVERGSQIYLAYLSQILTYGFLVIPGQTLGFYQKLQSFYRKLELEIKLILLHIVKFPQVKLLIVFQVYFQKSEKGGSSSQLVED